MNCPNCRAEMEGHSIEGTAGPHIELDICFACHVLWLDKRESIQLSPRGTLDLFKVMHDHRDDPRHALGGSADCPRCGLRLQLVKDIGKGGRFSYYSCPERHGRLTPFSEFLKEKQFVRALNAAEKSRMRAEVRQVQCSGCGASLDVARGFECDHCGSPITVLDADAVEKTLRRLEAAEAKRSSGDPVAKEARARALAAMESMRPYADDPYRRPALGRPVFALGADLLTTSLDAIFGR